MTSSATSSVMSVSPDMFSRRWDAFQSIIETMVSKLSSQIDPTPRDKWLTSFYTTALYHIHLMNTKNNEKIALEKTTEYAGISVVEAAQRDIPPKEGSYQFYFVHKLLLQFRKTLMNRGFVERTSYRAHAFEIAYIFTTETLNELIFQFEEGIYINGNLVFINKTEFPGLWEIIQEWTMKHRKPTRLFKLFGFSRYIRKPDEEY